MTQNNEADEPVNDGASGGVTRRQALRLVAAGSATAAVGASGPGPVPAAVDTAEAFSIGEVADWIGGGVQSGSKAVSGAKSVATDNQVTDYMGELADESGYTDFSELTTVGGRRYSAFGESIETPEVSLANVGMANALTAGVGGSAIVGYNVTTAVAGWMFGGESGSYEDYMDVRQSQREVDAVYDARTIELLRGSGSTTGLSAHDISEKFGVTVDDSGQPTGTTDAMNTQFSDVLSTEIRAAVAKVRANGGTEVDAINTAQDKADFEATTSLIELIEYCNGVTRALIDPVAAIIEADTMMSTRALEVVIGGIDTDRRFRAFDTGTQDAIPGAWNALDLDVDWSEQDRDEPDGYIDPTGVAWSTAYADGTWSLPMDPEEAGYDSHPVMIALAYDPGSFHEGTPLVTPVPPAGTDAIDWPAGRHRAIRASHQDLDINPVLYHYDLASTAMEQVYAAWDEWRSGISEFVSNLWNEFDAGSLDPDDIVSIEDLIARYDETDGLSRLKLEMAILTETGSNINLKITFDHPDVGEVKGHLGIEFADSAGADTRDLTAGETLAAADYESAYVIYPEESSGSGSLEMLDASKDITIVDVHGGAEDVAEEIEGYDVEITSGDPGDVVIDTQGETVDALENPGEYSIGIEVTDTNGATEVLNPDGFEPVDASSSYGVDGYVAPTTLAAGTDASVTAVDLATFSGRVTTPKNVTDVSEIESELADLRQTNAELEEQLRDEVLAGGGGGGGGGNGWYYAVGGAIAATAAALGLSGGVGE